MHTALGEYRNANNEKGMTTMKKWLLTITVGLLISSLTSCNTQIPTDTQENSQSFPSSEESQSLLQNEESADMNSSELPGIGGSLPATEFKNSFILLPDTLAHIIDTSKLADWENSINGVIAAGREDPYLYDNIYRFIRFFDIPREGFEELYYSTNLYYLYDYNFDLLYAKQISDEEAVFLLYEQVGDDTEQILLYYNLTTEELREIYRGESIHGYSEGSISSKDIWAIDTDGGNIYLLMQQ